MSPLTRIADLTRRLAEAEATIQALVSNQIDAVVTGDSPTPVLLARAQNALRASEERYRDIIETTSEGVWVMDANSITTFMNPRMIEMLGCESDMGIGRTPFDFLDAGGREALAAHLSKPVSHHAEVRFRRTDGSHVWALLGVTPLFDADGDYDGTLAMAMDITERKGTAQAIEALLRNTARRERILTTTLSSISDFAYTYDRDGRFLFVNKPLLDLWGIRLDEAVGKNFFDLGYPDVLAARLQRDVQRVFETGKPVTGETPYTNPAGHEGFYEYIFTPAFATDGSVEFVAGCTRDITARRSLEAQFHQSQKMEAVGRLAAGIAHDFNNLLTIILGFCELLESDLSPDDRHQSDVAEIQKAGQSAARLTRQLLSFSRKDIVEPKVLDLNAVVGELPLMLGRILGEDVAMVITPHSAPALVYVDRGQIEQVILNLAVNARDAMPGGGTLTIAVTLAALDAGSMSTLLPVNAGPYVALTVTDTGTGIPDEFKAKLFEPFFTTKDVGKGTGLGLATVHSIVMRVAGNLKVESEAGQGTSFTVYLPYVDAATLSPDEPALSMRPRQGVETILVVEDEAPLRELTRKLLRRHGYTVLVAASADEALEVFASAAAIDVVLTDVVMPGASGPELTRQLVAQRPTLKVIYMSGYTEDAIVHHGVIKPGIAFVHKPFTGASLAAKVREVMGPPRAMRSA